MSAGPSKWNLLRPKWLLLLAAIIAACIAMALLGRWQWRAARRHGDITNYSYACQWWAFTVFAVIMYARIVRDFLRSPRERPPLSVQTHESAYIAYLPPPSTVENETDPERVRVNHYLASLYAADGEALDGVAAVGVIAGGVPVVGVTAGGAAAVGVATEELEPETAQRRGTSA